MTPERLLANFDRISEAPYAIPRLRRFILDLAVRGKLVEQDPNDEPAFELLKRMQAENLVTKGKQRPGDNRPIRDDEIPFPVSSDILFARLAAIAKIEKGSTGIQKATPGQYPLVTLAEERATSAEYQLDAAAAIVPLISSTGHGHASLKRMHYQEGKFALGNILCAVIPFTPELISARFLYEYLWAYKEPLLVAKMIGTANVSLTVGKIGEAPIPLISPRAQDRLHELMTLCDRLDTAQAEQESWRDRLAAASLHRLNNGADVHIVCEHTRFHLRHLPRLTRRVEHIQQLRQTILNLAVRGKLVLQDPKDEPASNLIARIQTDRAQTTKEGRTGRLPQLPTIDEANAPFALSPGWAWARFPELGKFGRGKSKHRPRNDPSLFEGGTHLLVQTGDVARSNGVIETFTGKYNEVGLAQSAKWPKGTLCITIAANIADSGILSFDACFPDSVVGFVPAAIFPNARYFEYFIRTAKAELLEFAPATAQKNINLTILNEVLIPLPPLTEQHRIVAKVDELTALCDRLEAQLTTAQTESRRLLEAVLHEALNGAD